MQGVKRIFSRRKKKDSSPRGEKRRKGGGCYPFDLRLKAVKLHLEEGFDLNLVAEEVQISPETLRRWVEKYQQCGEKGLRTPYAAKNRQKTSPAVKAKITDIKKANPEYGKKRISQILRRMFFVKASPDTVQKTLKEEGLAALPASLLFGVFWFVLGPETAFRIGALLAGLASVLLIILLSTRREGNVMSKCV